MGQTITLCFKDFELKAELFDTETARNFVSGLPYKIELTQWGNEVYGSIGIDLGAENPVSEIPPGGIAYTNRGNYVCVFFGQSPAWPVEYIGRIPDYGWKKLLDAKGLDSVLIE